MRSTKYTIASHNLTIAYFARTYPRGSEERFVQAVQIIDWAFIEEIDDVDSQVDLFVARLMVELDKWCPVKKFQRKSTDDPWIDDRIRTEIRKRKGIFKREHRSQVWKRQKKFTTDLIRAARKAYYDREVEKIVNAFSVKVFVLELLLTSSVEPSSKLSLLILLDISSASLSSIDIFTQPIIPLCDC